MSADADDENSDEMVFGKKIEKPAEPVKRPPDSGKRHALSVLSVISSQNPESTRLSFSGLFPKAVTPVKECDDDAENASLRKRRDEQDDAPKASQRKRDVKGDANKPTKRKLDESVLEVGESKRSRVDLSYFEDGETDQNPSDPPKSDPVDPAEKQLPKTDIYSIGFEDAEDDPKRFASAKPARTAFVAGKKAAVNKLSENYVKINLVSVP